MRFLWPVLLLVSCSDAPRPEEVFEVGQKHYMGPAREEPNQEARCAGPLDSFQPEGGMVPTAQVAERVARIYLRSLYGGYFSDKNRLRIRLERGVWSIATVLPERTFGGVKEISICHSNGRVLGYSASQ